MKINLIKKLIIDLFLGQRNSLPTKNFLCLECALINLSQVYDCVLLGGKW